MRPCYKPSSNPNPSSCALSSPADSTPSQPGVRGHPQASVDANQPSATERPWRHNQPARAVILLMAYDIKMATWSNFIGSFSTFVLYLTLKMIIFQILVSPMYMYSSVPWRICVNFTTCCLRFKLRSFKTDITLQISKFYGLSITAET
jgi:hypothetical protein